MPFDPARPFTAGSAPSAPAAKPGFDPSRSFSNGEAQQSLVEEMHPAFTLADRLLVKNFSNDPEAAADYLRKQHPDLEIKTKGDRIIARSQGEKDFRPLDPDMPLKQQFTTFDGLKETGRDLGDLAYDIPAGVLQTLATAAAGTAGAAAGGIGALPAAAMAGAASGGGLEALRQTIGRALGVNKEISGTDIGINTGVGALSPVLLGTGASAGQVAKQGAENFAKQEAGQYLTQEAADAAKQAVVKNVADSQSGLIGRALGYAKDKITPALGELTSGVPAEVIKTARDNAPQLEKLHDGGLTDYVSGQRGKFVDTFNRGQQQVGQAISDAVDAAPDKNVDISGAASKFQDYISKLEDRAAEHNTPAVQQQLDQAKGIYRDVFGVAHDEKLPDGLSPRAAWELKQDLSSLSKIDKAQKGGLQSGLTGSLADKRLAGVARQAASDLTDELTSAVPELEGLNQKYERFSDLRKTLSPFFKSDEAAFKKLSTLGNPNQGIAAEVLQGADKDLGTDIVPSAQMLAAHKAFSKPSLLAKSLGGTTSTSRTIPMAMAGGALGYYAGAHSDLGQGGAGIGAATGGLLGAALGGPAALKAYMALGRFGSKAGQVLPLQEASNSAWQSLLQREREGQ